MGPFICGDCEIGLHEQCGDNSDFMFEMDLKDGCCCNHESHNRSDEEPLHLIMQKILWEFNDEGNSNKEK